MPIYEYQAIEGGCAYCQARFEAMQKMADPPITSCPDCDTPVQRVMSAVSFKTGSEKQLLSNSNVGKNGFARYEKSGDGTYAKTTGPGPDTIRSKP